MRPITEALQRCGREGMKVESGKGRKVEGGEGNRLRCGGEAALQKGAAIVAVVP